MQGVPLRVGMMVVDGEGGGNCHYFHLGQGYCDHCHFQLVQAVVPGAGGCTGVPQGHPIYLS